MNERIRALAIQTAGKGYDTFFTSDFDSPVKIEKFAELIIRECIKESMEEIVSDDDIEQEKDPLIKEYLKGNNQGIVDAVVRFRNYFRIQNVQA